MNKSGQFNFADTVSFVSNIVKGFAIGKHTFKAKVVGKVKNANAYIINVIELNPLYMSKDYDRRTFYLISLKKRYGYPIRQIELEWGNFSGATTEFIIPEHELTMME